MTKYSYAVIIFFIILLNVSFSYARIPDIVINQKKAVVTVYVNDKNGKQISTGSGFIIESNGIIATNYHVISKCIENNNTLLIKMENGAFFPLSEIINYNEENDVAILKVDGKELPKVTIAKDYKPKQGEDIVVIGSPLGLETTVSDGVISSVRGEGGIIQITAPVSPGSSGSPVFNSKGDVIGVATFLIKGGQNLNFAIPVKNVANLLKGTRPPKKNEIAESKPLPAPAPLHEPTAMDIKKAEEWYKKAIALWNGQKFINPKRAIAYLNSAIRLNPNDADSYRHRGIVYSELGQHEQAVEDYNKAISLKNDNANAYHSRGIAYDSLNQHQRAIEDFNEAISLNPDHTNAYHSRGIAYGSLNQYQRAIEDFNEAISLKPDNVAAYITRGLAYYKLNHYQRAIEDFNEVIRLNPDNTYAYNLRGIAYGSLNQHQRAIEDFNKAISLKPDNVSAYISRGIAYCKLNQHQRAIEDFNKAISLKPDNVAAYVNRGGAYSSLGQYNKAREDFDKGISLKPNDPGSYYNYACMYSLQKDAKQACEWLQLAIIRGFKNLKQIREDKDFDNVRNMECFINLLKESVN